jgi:hypothetical protein
MLSARACGGQHAPTDSVDEQAEMRRHAEEQAALFDICFSQADPSE